MSKPYSLFLWQRGCRSGPSLKRWGDMLVTSDPVRHGSSRAASERVRRSACESLWTDCARGRGSVGAEAASQWGVSADTNPEIAETLVQSAEARRERLIWCAGSGAVMTRARLPTSCCLRGGDRGAQCSAGADRGHSIKVQWPIIPAVPRLSRYGADAT